MRFLVVGTSGAGKSTFAAALAQALQCSYIELDELYWGPGWQAVSPEQFAQAVRATSAGESWVADGNYSAVQEVLWPRATHVVWLNYSRWTVFSRVFWRTLSRGLMRKRLSHGNRESLRMAFFSRDSILLWSMSTFAKNQRKFAALRNDPRYTHLEWTEMKKPSCTQQFIARHAATHTSAAR